MFTSAPTPRAVSDPPVTWLVVAFSAIYLIWGSTYLAIRWAVETMPPLTMASARFLVAGSVLYGWLRLSGTPRPTSGQWRRAGVSGALLLAGGNGAVVVAEQWVPSGLAALLVASVPLWLVLLDALFGSKTMPPGRVVVGLAAGFGGVMLLAGTPGGGAGGPREVLGVVILLCGAASWAAGSLVSRRMPGGLRPAMLVAAQMLTGSACLGLLAVLTGEPAALDVQAISVRSWASLAYLITAGALVGYCAYIWLLTVSTPARVGTYAYVNPVVALWLGWWLADEVLTFRSLAAAFIILVSVIVITAPSSGLGGRIRKRSPRLTGESG